MILTANGGLLFEKVWSPIPALDSKVCQFFPPTNQTKNKNKKTHPENYHLGITHNFTPVRITFDWRFTHVTNQSLISEEHTSELQSKQVI